MEKLKKNDLMFIEKIMKNLNTKKLNKFSKKDFSQIKKLLEDQNFKYYLNPEDCQLVDFEFDNLKDIYNSYEDLPKLNFSLSSEKVSHNFPELMCSLENIYSPAEYFIWLKRKKFIPEKYLASYKYDGCSLCIDLEDNKIVQAYTRGQDGKGNNLLNIFNGKIVNHKLFKVSIKFEIIMTYSNFGKFCKEPLLEEYNFANPRTAVSSIISRKDGNLFAKYLTIVPLELMSEEYKLSRLEQISILKTLKTKNTKFNILPIKTFLFFSEKFLTEKYEKINLSRSNLDYMIDGLVIEFIGKKNRKKLGYKISDGKQVPKFTLALKFPHKEKKTKIRRIEFDLANSNTGRITPCAVFDPVKIDGKIYKRVSLSNFQRLLNENLSIGEEVILSIRGDCLGYITPVNQKKTKIQTKNTFNITTCPVCKGHLEFNETGAWLFCTNPKCGNKITGKILRYAEKMRIKQVGENIIDTMVKSGYINNIIDLYNFDAKTLMKEERFGKKSVQVLLDNINKRKEVFDYEFLGSWGWNNIGRSLMKLVLEKISHKELLKLFKNSLKRDFIKQISIIDGFQNKLATYLWEGLNKDIDEIEEILEKKYVKINPIKELSNNNGKSLKFVITGPLKIMDRSQVKVRLISMGHSLIGSISKNTDYLVTNVTKSTEKLKKAKLLGIPIINETEFWDLIT